MNISIFVVEYIKHITFMAQIKFDNSYPPISLTHSAIYNVNIHYLRFHNFFNWKVMRACLINEFSMKILCFVILSIILITQIAINTPIAHSLLLSRNSETVSNVAVSQCECPIKFTAKTRHILCCQMITSWPENYHRKDGWMAQLVAVLASNSNILTHVAVPSSYIPR